MNSTFVRGLIGAAKAIAWLISLFVGAVIGVWLAHILEHVPLWLFLLSLAGCFVIGGFLWGVVSDD